MLLRYTPDPSKMQPWESPPEYDVVIRYDQNAQDARFERAPTEWMDIRGFRGITEAFKTRQKPTRVLIEDFAKFLEQKPIELQEMVDATRQNPEITWFATIAPEELMQWQSQGKNGTRQWLSCWHKVGQPQQKYACSWQKIPQNSKPWLFLIAAFLLVAIIAAYVVVPNRDVVAAISEEVCDKLISFFREHLREISDNIIGDIIYDIFKWLFRVLPLVLGGGFVAFLRRRCKRRSGAK